MTDKQKLEIISTIIGGNLGKARELCERYTSYRNESYRNELLTSIRNQYANFTLDMLKERPEDIFNQALEIYVKTELNSFFADTELDDETYKTLARVNENSNEHLLDRLYDYFLRMEYTKIESYEDISEWIGWFCDKEKESMKK